MEAHWHICASKVVYVDKAKIKIGCFDSRALLKRLISARGSIHDILIRLLGEGASKILLGGGAKT